MMVKTDLHTHTVYSDGKDTPEQMVLSAINKGVKVYGISDHSYTPFDTSYCMTPDRYAEYFSVLTELKEKYKDKIDLRRGIELDYYSCKPDITFDYIIGSVHYVKAGSEYIPVDFSPDALTAGVDRYFGGDIYAFIEEYYRTEADVVGKTGSDIIGHFDLVTKFNERGDLFDESDPRYINAYRAAADRLIKTGKPFEIKFGAIPRGCRTTPYPSAEILAYLKSKKAPLVLSSDGHKKEDICFGFDSPVI